MVIYHALAGWCKQDHLNVFIYFLDVRECNMNKDNTLAVTDHLLPHFCSFVEQETASAEPTNRPTGVYGSFKTAGALTMVIWKKLSPLLEKLLPQLVAKLQAHSGWVEESDYDRRNSHNENDQVVFYDHQIQRLAHIILWRESLDERGSTVKQYKPP
jgi:hypothetical protein